MAQSTAEQVRPPKLALPATYKRDPPKLTKKAKIVHAESRDAGTDPMSDLSSFDPYTRGVSTLQELRCYNIGVQDTQGEARIDERASLVVAFGTTFQEPIPLYGMINTGSGVSILSLKVHQKIASAHALSLLPYDIQLYAANGKTINTIISVGRPYSQNELYSHSRPFGSGGFLARPQLLAYLQCPGGFDGHEGHHSRPQSSSPF